VFERTHTEIAALFVAAAALLTVLAGSLSVSGSSASPRRAPRAIASRSGGEQARRRRDDLARAQELDAAGEVADAPARFLDDQRARRDVAGPRLVTKNPSRRPAAR
jgi:hypothetical protein